MRNPREAPAGDVAPYWEESKLHEFVGDLKIVFGFLTALGLGTAVFLLLVGLPGAPVGLALALFAAGGWITMLVVDRRAWKSRRSAREAAESVSRALVGGEDVAPTAAAAPPAEARPMAVGLEPGESRPRGAVPATPAPRADARRARSGGRWLVGFLLVALVLASAAVGTRRMALGILLFFVLAVFYGWPFLVAMIGGDDDESASADSGTRG